MSLTGNLAQHVSFECYFEHSMPKSNVNLLYECKWCSKCLIKIC